MDLLYIPASFHPVFVYLSIQTHPIPVLILCVFIYIYVHIPLLIYLGLASLRLFVVSILLRAANLIFGSRSRK